MDAPGSKILKKEPSGGNQTRGPATKNLQKTKIPLPPGSTRKYIATKINLCSGTECSPRLQSLVCKASQPINSEGSERDTVCTASYTELQDRSVDTASAPTKATQTDSVDYSLEAACQTDIDSVDENLSNDDQVKNEMKILKMQLKEKEEKYMKMISIKHKIKKATNVAMCEKKISELKNRCEKIQTNLNALQEEKEKLRVTLAEAIEQNRIRILKKEEAEKNAIIRENKLKAVNQEIETKLDQLQKEKEELRLTLIEVQKQNRILQHRDEEVINSQKKAEDKMSILQKSKEEQILLASELKLELMIADIEISRLEKENTELNDKLRHKSERLGQLYVAIKKKELDLCHEEQKCKKLQMEIGGLERKLQDIKQAKKDEEPRQGTQPEQSDNNFNREHYAAERKRKRQRQLNIDVKTYVV